MTTAVLFLCMLMLLAPASKPAPDPQTVAINNAIEELAKEFDAVLKDPSKKLREEPDYFKGNPNADVTPEGIVRVIERPMGGDPRLQAYVKWQLLSAVSGAFDEKLAPRVGQAYLNAPPPIVRPGVTAADRQLMNRELQRGKVDLGAVNARYAQRQAEFDATHAPLFKYRDALYQRLPPGPATFAVGLEDVKLRVQTAAPYSGLLDSILGGIRNWLLDGKASRGQLQVLIQLVEQVKKTKPPGYYEKAQLDSHGSPYWKTRTPPSPDAEDRLSSFIKELQEGPAR